MIFKIHNFVTYLGIQREAIARCNSYFKNKESLLHPIRFLNALCDGLFSSPKKLNHSTAHTSILHPSILLIHNTHSPTKDTPYLLQDL